MVANVDHICSTDSARLTDSNIDCRDLERGRFDDSAGRIAHNSNRATQDAMVCLRAKVIDHLAPFKVRFNPLPDSGPDDPSSGVGIRHGEDHKKPNLIERRQKLVNLPLNLLVFEGNGVKCY
jgi:hypothetical protein